jgi:plasmid stability protein
MATLTIRNLPDDVHAALRVQAAKNGRSMEEEVRVLLAASTGAAVTGPAKAAFDPERARAAAERLREHIRQANGGRMPDDSVDQYIAEKRAEVAAEEAAFAQSLAMRATEPAP